MIFLDSYLFTLIHGLSGIAGWLDFLAVFFALFLPYFIAAAFIIYYVFKKGYSLKDKKYMIVTPFVAAIISRFFLGTVIKYYFDRPRPFLLYEFNPLIEAGGLSFPSGHAMFWFAFSACVFSFNRKMGWGLFVLSFLNGFFRVFCGVHYPADIISGAIVGYVVGFMVFKMAEFLYRRSGEPRKIGGKAPWEIMTRT
jgi:undecaprenyl-diphosphatase